MAKDFHQITPQDISEFNIPITAKLYYFYKNLYLSLLTFPKAHRYYLGLKLDAITLEVFELLIKAGTSKGQQKTMFLDEASIKLDILKIMIRLAKDTQCLDSKKYLEHSGNLQEIGRMLGGWARATKQNLQEF